MDEDSYDQGLKDFAEALFNEQEDLPREFKEAYQKNSWDLYESDGDLS